MRKWSPGRYLRARIMVAVATGILILLAVMGVNSYQMVRQLTDQLLQERLRSAQATAKLLDGTLAQSFQQLQALASSPVLTAPDAAGGQRQLLRQLRPQIALASYGFYLLDATGRLKVAEPVHPGDLGVDFRGNEAVRSVLGGQPAAASDLEFLGPARVPVVLLCVPLPARAGGLCASVDLRREQFLPYITEYGAAGRVATTWHAAIIDAHGLVLATTRQAAAFQLNDHPLFHRALLAARRAAVGRAAAIAGGRINGYHVMAFAPQYQAAWGVTLGQTEGETFAQIVSALNRNLLIGATALVLALLFAWWDTGTILRPLRFLAAAAQRIAAGDLDTVVQVERHDEIGSLANAYDTMRGRLKVSLAQVQQVAVLSERDRISRDLHDHTLQALYGVDLALQRAVELIDGDPREAKRRLDETLDVHDRIIQDIRDYVHNLRPHETTARTLRIILETIAGEFHEHSRIPISLNVEGADAVPPLPDEVRNQLVFIVREALANVIRHAQAGGVTVEATVRDQAFTLRVQDDGCGFDPAGLSSCYGLGLGSMAERARAIGGRLRVTAAPGAGTTVEVSVPRSGRVEVEVRNGESAAHPAGG